MKLSVINDTHFGVRNASDIFLSYQEDFFLNQFFPYCVENGITNIIHIGDFFEHRKYVAIKTLNRTRNFFLEQLRANRMKMDIIPGNHDIAFRNTNSLSALNEIHSMYSNDVVEVHMTPIVKRYGSLDIALLPWITNDNYKESLDFVATSGAPVLMAHLELQGFEMMKGAPVQSHGLNSNLFSNYEMVLSGHYHTKSEKGNIHYLGTQYELSWSDADDPKFFHVLDTESRILTPVRNNRRIFRKLFYNDSLYKNAKELTEYVSKIPIEDIKDTYVKIIVTGKNFPRFFDIFNSRVQSAGPFDIKIIDSVNDSFMFGDPTADSSEDFVFDTFSILNNSVDLIESSLDKDKIKSILHEIYIESQNVDILTVK